MPSRKSSGGDPPQPLKVAAWLWVGEEDKGDQVTRVYVSDNDEVKFEIGQGEDGTIGVYMSRSAATEIGRQLQDPSEVLP